MCFIIYLNQVLCFQQIFICAPTPYRKGLHTYIYLERYPVDEWVAVHEMQLLPQTFRMIHFFNELIEDIVFVIFDDVQSSRIELANAFIHSYNICF